MIYRQGSARLGAGAATTPVASQAAPAGAATSSTTALGGLTAGAAGGANQRATGNVRRTARGLGRRAEDAARNFYVTDGRYTQNVGDPTQPEDYKVYSNDPTETDPVALSQAVPQYVPPPVNDTPPAPVQQEAKPVQPTIAPVPTPAVQAPASPPPLINLSATNPGNVRAEAGVSAPANPVAGIRGDTGNLSATLAQPPVTGQTGPSLVNSVRSDTASGNLSASLPQPPPTQLISNPDVQGFLLAQKRNLLGR